MKIWRGWDTDSSDRAEAHKGNETILKLNGSSDLAARSCPFGETPGTLWTWFAGSVL